MIRKVDHSRTTLMSDHRSYFNGSIFTWAACSSRSERQYPRTLNAIGSPSGARRRTSTDAPLQNPISSNRRRTSAVPPTSTTLPQQPTPSLFSEQVAGGPTWEHPAKSQAFSIMTRLAPEKRGGHPSVPSDGIVVETEFQ